MAAPSLPSDAYYTYLAYALELHVRELKGQENSEESESLREGMDALRRSMSQAEQVCATKFCVFCNSAERLLQKGEDEFETHEEWRARLEAKGLNWWEKAQ